MGSTNSAVEAIPSDCLPGGTKPFPEPHRHWGDNSSMAANAALLCLNTFSPRVSIGLKKNKPPKKPTEEKNDLIQSWLNSMGRLSLNVNELQQARGAGLTSELGGRFPGAPHTQGQVFQEDSAPMCFALQLRNLFTVRQAGNGKESFCPV